MLRDEHWMEFFSRLQLTQILAVTPDLQVYFTPAEATGGDTTVVFGFRLQLAI